MGEVAFVRFSTRGRGAVPPLPEDVRRLIYEATFPRILRRCSRCERVLAVESMYGSIFLTRPCTIVDSEVCCMNCLLPAEALIGQMPRRGFRRWRSRLVLP